MSDSYDVRLGSAAKRAYAKLPEVVRRRVRAGLEELASEVATPGRIEGKKVKTIQGRGDSFHRLRIGDHRVLYDVIHEDRAVMVLGIVHRSDLERWLRSR